MHAILETADIQKLAKRAGVDKPVMAVRVAGNRIELHLLGGEVVPLKAANEPDRPAEANTGQGATTITTAAPHDILPDLTAKRLRAIAANLGMSGYSRLPKQLLIGELASYSADQLQQAINDTA